jgi:hypothetical protein
MVGSISILVVLGESGRLGAGFLPIGLVPLELILGLRRVQAHFSFPGLY